MNQREYRDCFLKWSYAQAIAIPGMIINEMHKKGINLEEGNFGGITPFQKPINQDMIVSHIIGFMLASEQQFETTISQEEVPETWWQHFKQDCFPEWLKEWFPVRNRVIETKRLKKARVCPHMGIPAHLSEGNNIHLNFLRGIHDETV